MLDGSIANLGNRYILSIQARDCRTGGTLVTEQAPAAKPEDVLKVLSRIAARVRTRLGQWLPTIADPQPLEPSTTSSIEALRAASTARAMVYKNGVAAGMPHLLRAIAIDPQFAMAYAEYAFYCGNTGQTDLAKEHAIKAYSMIVGVSDWERF